MLDIKLDSMTENWDELVPLFEKHCHEVHLFPDKIPLDPSLEHYKRCEEAGILRTYIVRDDDKIIGYAIYVVHNNPHYWGHIYAVNDIIFLEPDYRHSQLAENLITLAELDMKADRGVSVITYHMKPFKPFRGLMERCGYSLGEELYAKCLVE